MKINYERTVPIMPSLSEVRPGELFRAVKGERVYMRTNTRASDDFTSEHELPFRRLYDAAEHGNIKFEDVDYEDLIFCLDMETGKLVLMPMTLNVEKLIGELMIKERSCEM